METTPRVLFALLLAGCCEHYGHYAHSDYGYAEPGPPAPMRAQPINLGQGVRGSDGSYGWRSRAAHIEEAYGHAVALAEMHGCIMYSREGEARAECGDVRIVIRRDLEHLYRLCDAGTERSRCAETWATISR